jgi:YegS/Rv2252/BmrU family lipid kinase
LGKKTILFLVNPIAGTKNNTDYNKYIDQYIDKSLFDYTIKHSQKQNHATDLIKNGSDSYDVIVAVGGDGTINEVINGFNGNKPILGIIPAGSGNGLAYTLGIPFKIKDAIELINNYEKNIKRIDVVSINDRLAVNQLGFGFDAHVANLFSTTKRRGLLKYAALSLREYFNYKNSMLSFYADGKHCQEHTFVTNFSNNTQFGNNAHIAPLADLQDGYLEISFLKHFPKILLPIILLMLFTKTIHWSRYYSCFKAEEAVIPFQKDVILNLDGEPIKMTEDLKVKILPLALRVIAFSKD